MTDTPRSLMWQDTVAKAVASMEQRTGLQLAGLPPTEITSQVQLWIQAKKNGTSMRLKDSLRLCNLIQAQLCCTC